VSRLVRNIGYNVVGQLLLIVLGFVSARYVFAQLGKDVLGILYFAVMLNTIVVAVLELGITTTTVKEVSANQHKDPAYVRRIVRSGAFFYWLGYALAGLALLVAAPWFVRHWITLETVSPDLAVDLLRILGASTLLALPQTFYVSVLRGVQRMGIPNTIDVGFTAIQQAGIIAIISATGDVILVAWWIALVAVVKLLALATVVAKLFDWGALVPGLDLEIMRRNRTFAVHMLAISALAMIHIQTDKVVISALLPVSSIGIYGLLYGTLGRGNFLTSAVAQGAFPALSELVHSGDREQLIHLYHRLHDLVCYGLVPVFALLAFVTYPVFSVVLEPALAATLVLPAAVLATGFYLNGTLTIPYYVCLAMNRPDIGSRQNFVALFTTLPMTLLLTWQFGFAGAAGGWVWYQLFAYAYSMPRVCRECLGILPWQWFRHILVTLLCAACSFGVAAAIVSLVAPRSTAALLVAYSVGLVVYSIATWVTMAADSRAALTRILRANLGWTGAP
jgi:O-antigen/teichoic acid export membrane protein